MSLNDWFKRDVSYDETIIIFLLIIMFSFILRASNLYLFTYEEFWVVSINIGGTIFPIIFSIYLAVRCKLKPIKILIAIVIVSIIAYMAYYTKADEGIVSPFPLYLLPIIIPFIISYLLIRKENRNIASLGYISGMFGILLGVTLFHLPELLNIKIKYTTDVIIGVDSDSILILGILAVITEIILFYHKKRKSEREEY